MPISYISKSIWKTKTSDIIAPMTKFNSILPKDGPSLSFELFPPKTPEGYEKLLNTIKAFSDFKPDFFSCTYGAGGGSRDKTLDIVAHIQNTHHIPAVAHLTCVLHTRDEIKSILDDMQRRGISRVLALRGDPPKHNPNWQPSEENFQYSSELIAFIRHYYGDAFTIAAAGFPEGHLLAASKEADAKVLKTKIDAGANLIITQLFFDNSVYTDYLRRLYSLGVSAPILPGILPITDYNALVRFAASCGATIPQKVHDIFKPIADNPHKTMDAGIAFAVQQCRDLLNHGAPGLHFYTLNKISPTDQIIKELKLRK